MIAEAWVPEAPGARVAGRTPHRRAPRNVGTHHASARDAIQSAAAALTEAWTAYRNAASHYDQQLWRYGTLARTPHPHQALDRLNHRIAATQRRLDQARADLAVLTGVYDVLARVTRVLWRGRSLARSRMVGVVRRAKMGGGCCETATCTAGRR
jgi:hypothetical protein